MLHTGPTMNSTSVLASDQPLRPLFLAAGGASVGQYGPLVHFGATMGSALRQISRRFLTTDVFIGCGVAGAIAAGFNALIAGMVFAHEAILRHFSLRAIAPIAVASISHPGFRTGFSVPLPFLILPPHSWI